jgi:hypothetical protein
MGMTTGTLVVETSFRATGTFAPPGQAGTLSSSVVKQANNQQSNYAFGTGSSQVDTVVYQDRVFANGASATYDLYTGTDLLDINSGTAAFRTIRDVGIYVASGGDTSGVRIGGAASNEWVGFFAAAGDKHLIFPSGPAYRAGSPAGAVVTSSTKNLLIENLGAVAVTVRIVIGGTVQVSGGLMGILGLTYP